jgi:hypothetical protein
MENSNDGEDDEMAVAVRRERAEMHTEWAQAQSKTLHNVLRKAEGVHMLRYTGISTGYLIVKTMGTKS